jgi:hypothetical protein
MTAVHIGLLQRRAGAAPGGDPWLGLAPDVRIESTPVGTC